MDISLKKIPKEQRPILENLFPYYVYDMTEFMKWPPNENGQYTFTPSTLDFYWQKSDHTPYFISAGNELAGFVLVRRYADTQRYDIEQFFVLRKFKRNGIGKKALEQVVKLHPGSWQIRVLLENTGALQFWKSAVTNIMGSQFTLTKENDDNLIMYFLKFEA
ncbi:MAG: hypothetical protein CENE_00399 [Candidatus Celerinatantimonas neptuna]|nr:MAG: hypothetical protein CENE_00399 [Candidatus Celerinatantimonas neptuna]